MLSNVKCKLLVSAFFIIGDAYTNKQQKVRYTFVQLTFFFT